MLGANFRLPYQPDQTPSNAQAAGGLLGLIQQAILREGLNRSARSGPDANAGSERNPYGGARPSGGVLGPAFAMQAGPYHAPFAKNNAPPSSPLQDPNFRQLSSALAVPRLQGGAHAFNQPSDQSSPLDSGFANSGSQDGVRSSAQNTGPDTAQVVPVQWGGVPLPRPWPVPPIGPVPPSGPVSPIPIPKPAIPEAWRWAWPLLQLYPKLITGSLGSGGDRDCDQERREARKICVEAYANGWKSDYDVGPYKDPWTIDDCKRGLISERCGGNRVEKDE